MGYAVLSTLVSLCSIPPFLVGIVGEKHRQMLSLLDIQVYEWVSACQNESVSR